MHPTDEESMGCGHEVWAGVKMWWSGGVVGEKVKGCPSIDSLLPMIVPTRPGNATSMILPLPLPLLLPLPLPLPPRLVLKISPMYREVTPSQLLVSRYEDGKVRRVAL